eukprot:scaffold31254_cov45-Phaeocystis_antarctica.AAC.1
MGQSPNLAGARPSGLDVGSSVMLPGYPLGWYVRVASSRRAGGARMSGSESKRQRKDALAAAADTTGSVLIGGGANETDETTAEPASVLQPPMMTGAQVGAQPAGGPPYANSLVAASIVPAQPMAQQQAQPQGVPGSTCGPGRGHAPRPRRGKYRVVDGKKHMEFM